MFDGRAWAVIISAALIAITILLTNRWHFAPAPNGHVYLLDGWSGVVTLCSPEITGNSVTFCKGP
jgi:hypothetical protein